MTEGDYITLHHRGFTLRQRAASEAEWLALMSDMALEHPRAALSEFMHRRNANVIANGKRRREAAVSLMERVEADGAAFWVPIKHELEN